MQVCVIQNTEPKKINIPMAATTGALAGLAVRQFLPPSRQEIDNVLFGQTSLIKENNYKQAKKAAIDKVNQLLNKDPHNEALKLFLERAKANSTKQAIIVKNKIKNSSKEVRAGVNYLVGDFINKVRAARVMSNAGINSTVKQNRAIGAFIIPGVVLATVGSYIYNVIGRMTQD